MQLLKQSTAATVLIGPVLDSTGAAYTGMVIGDFNITKNGSTAALASAAAVTHSHNGMYLLDLTTGNTDTAGRVSISSNKATYAMAPYRASVLVATVFDALITNATTAAGGLGDIQRMAGTALTGRDIGASVLLSSGTGTGQLNFTSGVVSANVTQFGGSNGAFSSGRPEVNTTHAAGTAWGSGAITAASIASDAITAAKIADGAIDAATFAAGAINAAAIASDAITDAKVASDVTIASVTGAVGSVTGNVGGNVTGSVGSVSGAVGSVTGNVGGNVTGSVGSVASGGISSASFSSGAITAAAIAADAIGASELAADAVAEIAAGVWDLSTSGHTTSGTFGAAAVAAGGAGDPWSTLIPGAYGAGTAGKIIGDNLNATISSRSSHSASDVWAVATRVLTAGTNIALAKGTGVTGFTDLSASDVRSAVGLGSANLDTQLDALPTNAELATALGTADDAVLSAIAALSIPTTAQVATAVFTTQMTESYRATNAAPTLAQAAFELIAHMGESSISGTTKTLKKVDGSTTAKTYTLNDGTTPTAITETT